MTSRGLGGGARRGRARHPSPGPPATQARQPPARPRVTIFFEGTGAHAVGIREYLVVQGEARITNGGAPKLLHGLAQTHVGRGTRFPPMPNPSNRVAAPHPGAARRRPRPPLARLTGSPAQRRDPRAEDAGPDPRASRPGRGLIPCGALGEHQRPRCTTSFERTAVQPIDDGQRPVSRIADGKDVREEPPLRQTQPAPARDRERVGGPAALKAGGAQLAGAVNVWLEGVRGLGEAGLDRPLRPCRVQPRGGVPIEGRPRALWGGLRPGSAR